MCDELEKLGNSALRKAFDLVPELVGYTHKSEPVVRWAASVGSKPVGFMVTEGNRVGMTIMEDAFKGMGLGKKLYGEVIRRMPEQTLKSDSSVSDSARRVWLGMKNRSGYSVEEPRLGKPFARFSDQTYSLRNQFKASLPSEASIDPNLPDFDEVTKRKMVNEEKRNRRRAMLNDYGPFAALGAISGAALGLGLGKIRKKSNGPG